MVSTTYIPEINTDFQLIKIDTYAGTRHVHRLGEENEQQDDIVKPGISNGGKKNKQYGNLLADINAELVDNDAIIEIYRKQLHIDTEIEVATFKQGFRYNYLTKFMTQEQKLLILHKKSEGWSFSELSAVFNFDTTTIRAVINEIKYIQTQKKNQLRANKLPYKITLEHYSEAN